jgi:hypothetical protein
VVTDALYARGAQFSAIFALEDVKLHYREKFLQRCEARSIDSSSVDFYFF